MFGGRGEIDKISFGRGVAKTKRKITTIEIKVIFERECVFEKMRYTILEIKIKK